MTGEPLDPRSPMTVVAVHGAGPQANGEGSGGLFASLARALAGVSAMRTPAMPEPERPTYRAWSAALERTLAETEGPLLLVGHSLGGSVLLKHLTDVPRPRPIHGLFLIAAPYWDCPDWTNEAFALRTGCAAALPAALPVYVYHGRDDEVVPPAHAERYGAELPQAVVRLLDGRGHGFDDGLPELVADLRACCDLAARRAR